MQVSDFIARYALEGCLRAHRELELEKDTDWLNLALAYLRTLFTTEGDTPYLEMKPVLAGLASSSTSLSGMSAWFLGYSLTMASD